MESEREAMLRLREEGDGIRALRRGRRRFASTCFLVAGVAFGTLLYLVRTRARTVFDGAHLPLLAGLAALMVALFWLGANADAEVGRLEEKLAEIDDQLVRLLRRR